MSIIIQGANGKYLAVKDDLDVAATSDDPKHNEEWGYSKDGKDILLMDWQGNYLEGTKSGPVVVNSELTDACRWKKIKHPKKAAHYAFKCKPYGTYMTITPEDGDVVCVKKFNDMGVFILAKFKRPVDDSYEKAQEEAAAKAAAEAEKRMEEEEASRDAAARAEEEAEIARAEKEALELERKRIARERRELEKEEEKRREIERQIEEEKAKIEAERQAIEAYRARQEAEEAEEAREEMERERRRMEEHMEREKQKLAREREALERERLLVEERKRHLAVSESAPTTTVTSSVFVSGQQYFFTCYSTGKNLRILPDGSVDGRGGSGKWARFYVHRDAHGNIRLQSFGNPRNWLAIKKAVLQGRGDAGRHSLFRPIFQPNGWVCLRKLTNPKAGVGIFPNGHPKAGPKTGTGPHGQFKVTPVNAGARASFHAKTGHKGRKGGFGKILGAAKGIYKKLSKSHHGVGHYGEDPPDSSDEFHGLSSDEDDHDDVLADIW